MKLNWLGELELSSEDTASVAYDGFTGLTAARGQSDLMILGWLLPGLGKSAAAYGQLEIKSPLLS